MLIVPKMRRSVSFVLLVLLACGGGHTETNPSGSEVTPTPTDRSRPERAFGIELRHPFSPVPFSRHSCVAARDFAYRRGSYSIVTDDALFGVPHEHQDTAAVLAALDSFTVCVGQTRDFNATAVVTLSDSIVGHALVFWPQESQAPAYDRMLTILEQTYGAPFQNEHGVRFWSVDSIKLYLNRRGRILAQRLLASVTLEPASASSDLFIDNTQHLPTLIRGVTSAGYDRNNRPAA